MNIKQLVMSALISLTIIGCAGGMSDGCCGWSRKGTNATGQVKQVISETPMVCPDYKTVDISMGLMRNGNGSMSSQDIILYVQEKDVAGLVEAAKVGMIIDFVYDTKG